MARSTSTPVTAPGTAVNAVPGHSLAFHLLLSLRPGQWTKNLVIFAGVLFGKKLFDATAVGEAIAAFAVFCALSGVVYLVNDIADRETDRLHPLRLRNRGTLVLQLSLGMHALGDITHDVGKADEPAVLAADRIEHDAGAETTAVLAQMPAFLFIPAKVCGERQRMRRLA